MLAVDLGVAVELGVADGLGVVVDLVRSDFGGVVFADSSGSVSCFFEVVAFEDSVGLSVGLEDAVFVGDFAGGSWPSIAATEGRFHPNQAFRRGCMTK